MSKLEQLMEFNDFQGLLQALPDQFDVIVVPQIQLAPYVASALFSDTEKSKTLLVIGPTGNPYFKYYLGPVKRAVFANVRSAAFSSFSLWRSFLSKCKSNGKTVGAIYLHAFAGGANHTLAKLLTSNHLAPSRVRVFADGSRNNLHKEFKEPNDVNILEYLVDKYAHTTRLSIIRFSHSEDKFPTKLNQVHVNYRQYDRYLSLLPRSIISEGGRRTGLLPKRVLLVLMRYYGRPPYEFTCEDQRNRSAIKAFEEIAQGHDLIVIRFDNRFADPEQLLSFARTNLNCEVEEFSKFIGLEKRKSKEVLFESLLLSDPVRFRSIKTIYCYDSSFPLIAQSALIRSALPRGVRLVWGAPAESLASLSNMSSLDAFQKRIDNLNSDLVALWKRGELCPETIHLDFHKDKVLGASEGQEYFSMTIKNGC